MSIMKWNTNNCNLYLMFVSFKLLFCAVIAAVSAGYLPAVNYGYGRGLYGYYGGFGYPGYKSLGYLGYGGLGYGYPGFGYPYYR